MSATRIDARAAALAAAETLLEAGHAAYFVGGCVRDQLMQKPVKDYDVATSARPEQVLKLFPKALTIGMAFGIVNVVIDEVNVEVASFREDREYSDGRRPESIVYADTPEADARRRDFTVNALFQDVRTGAVLDFVGGMDDIRQGRLRCVGDPRARFTEDHLRMLRAVRFTCRLGLDMDSGVSAAVAELAPRAAGLSLERIRDELTKMFVGHGAARAAHMLSDLGLLRVILPEVEAMRGILQPERHHPEGDVFEHTTLMLSHIPWPDPELAWAALLHDVGKPPTFAIGEDGAETFRRHADIGAEMAAVILERLRFSSAQTARIVQAVKGHMRIASAMEMRPGKLRRLLSEDTFPLELELHRADCAASNQHKETFAFLLDNVTALEGRLQLPPPLVKGADLIAMGVKPGPSMGRMLRAVSDRQIEGELLTREQALNWIMINKEGFNEN